MRTEKVLHNPEARMHVWGIVGIVGIVRELQSTCPGGCMCTCRAATSAKVYQSAPSHLDYYNITLVHLPPFLRVQIPFLALVESLPADDNFLALSLPHAQFAQHY